AMNAYILTLLPGRYAVCLLPQTVPIPEWAWRGDFCSITRTGDELSIICTEDALPVPLPAEMQVARDWVLLRVEGPFGFDVTGVVAALATALAQAGVVLLAIATYQTDYLLVKAEQMEAAVTALFNAGHRVTF